MRKVFRQLVLLAFLWFWVGFPVPGFAQIGVVSNLQIDGGLKIGFTTSAWASGVLRYDPSITSLQVYASGQWKPLSAELPSQGLVTSVVFLGTGSVVSSISAASNSLFVVLTNASFGSGSGFPLTSNVSAANFSIFDVFVLDAYRLEAAQVQCDSAYANILFSSTLGSDYAYGDIASYNSAFVGSGLFNVMSATTGVFNSLFATSGSFNVLSAGSLSANSLSANSLSASYGSFNDLTVFGSLTVWSNTYFNHVINVSTTVVMGTTTTYVNEVIYTTNMVAIWTNVFTNFITYTTNYVWYDTYVNMGGTFDASQASWVAFPHALYSQSQGVIASNVWNFSNATVVGLGLGDMVRRTGETNAVDLTQTLVYVATNSPAPTSVTSRAWVESYMASNIYAIGTSLTYYVQKTGETGVIDLSSAQVYVASPTSPSNPVTLAWVLAQGYGTGSGNLTVTNSPSDPYSVLYVSGIGSPTTGYWARLSMQHWIEGYETNSNVAGYYWAPANTPLITINRKPQFFIGADHYIAFSRPDNTATGGMARGNAAVDLQIVRTASNQVASGASSAILSGGGNLAAGNYSVVVGGIFNQATAERSIVGGGGYNTVGALYSSVLGGLNQTIGPLSQFHFVINGFANSIHANDTYASILNGFQNRIDGDYPGDSYGANTILNGYQCQINASQESVFLGGWYSRITNSQFAVVFGESVTNEASRRTLLLNARASAIRSATNATILNAHNTTISGATNVVAIHTHGVVITQNNWAVIGNIWISLAGTNNPPREGAIAFANGNWRFAVSNQWRTPLYE